MKGRKVGVFALSRPCWPGKSICQPVRDDRHSGNEPQFAPRRAATRRHGRTCSARCWTSLLLRVPREASARAAMGVFGMTETIVMKHG